MLRRSTNRSPRIAPLILSRSSARNSFHSVTTTVTSAPATASSALVHQATPGRSGSGFSFPCGSYALVIGICHKGNTKHSDCLAFERAPSRPLHAPCHGDLALAFDRLHLLDEG